VPVRRAAVGLDAHRLTLPMHRPAAEHGALLMAAVDLWWTAQAVLL